MSKKVHIEKEDLRKKSDSLFQQLKNKEQEWEILMLGAKTQATSIVENAKTEADGVLREARGKRTQLRQDYEAKKKAQEKKETEEADVSVVEKEKEETSKISVEEDKKIQEIRKKAHANIEKAITDIIKGII